MSILKVFSFSLLTISAIQVAAQEIIPDSVVVIDELIIQGDRLEEYAIGVSVQKLDSSKLHIYQSQSITSLLSGESGVTIKSYGSGGLATPSIRGGGSSHTPVLWNGVSLQNSMNGNSSLSLIPTSFFDKVEVQYGGGSTLFGSGVVSGAIHLNNNSLSQQKDHVKINLGIGSYGDQSAFFQLKNGIGKWNSDLRLFYRTVDNDFQYINTSKFRKPTETQTNAGFETFGLSHSNEIAINEHSILTSSIWLNHYDKDLQSLMVQDTSKSHQEDNSVRMALNYQNFKNNNPLNIKTAFLYDELQYTNPDLQNPVSNHYTNSFINEVEKSILFNQSNRINLGLNYTFEQANSDGLSNEEKRNRIAAFGSYRATNVLKNLNTSINFRQEIVDGKFIPMVLSAGFDYLFSKSIVIKGNASKNYRVPTFNDLYWRTDTYSSGNPDLVPESGYNIDFGIKEFIQNNNTSISFGQDFYWTTTKNWIVWLPNENGQWTPENKKSGESYGAELSFNGNVDLNKWKVFSDGFFKYSISNLMDTDDPENKQSMLYEPKFSFRGTIGISYQKYSLSYNHNYFSERKYDQQNYLDAYQLGSVYFNFYQPIQKNLLNLSFNINNVWNTEYQVIAWYAMPPANYQLTISYQFNL